ncbi:DUF58 domain-containing protein [Roseiflexus sp.]|uniref:DUF58 domain-containing protein n=1 Tax=Roseiflexus sp. TaxID=2562120 RepID=UPI0021DC67B9|nr:DUF58 domain-containing protein [Roseiflexus sp.]GIW01556.1 MAG: hypothetical protein KatS3mg058_2959 [Roseiflexus sp.]
MIPTLRLYLLLLPGAALVAGVALTPLMLWIAVAYLVVVAALVVADYLLTDRPAALEVERIHDSRLSLGANNPVTILIASRARRPLTLQIRDEHPDDIPADATIVTGNVEPFALLEARYHLRPVRRGDYTFGNINIRYLSVFGTFVQQARYPAEAAFKVYPNVLDIRTYDLLARKGLLLEMGLRPARIFGQGVEFERLREYRPDDEFRRINWKATARRGKPIAAEYETERSQYIISVIDTGRLMRAPVEDSDISLARLDYAINATLLLSYVVTLKGDHAGMLTFADDVRTYLSPRHGKSQFYRMLESVVQRPVRAGRVRLCTRTDLSERQAQATITGHRVHRSGDPRCGARSDRAHGTDGAASPDPVRGAIRSERDPTCRATADRHERRVPARGGGNAAGRTARSSSKRCTGMAC